MNKRTKGPLTQYTYNQSCVYDGAWNLYTIVARGIIVDHERIVAAPFPKFFNLQENKTEIPDLPFQVYEKVDGSLIIVYWYDGEWHTATKGSFDSDQARWAKQYIQKFKLDRFAEWVTYLFEAIYPENRIVVKYDKEDMVLLGAYDTTRGIECDRDSLRYVSDTLGITLTKAYDFDDLNSIVDQASILPSNEEGYIVRYEDGTRVKIKGAEYCRLHKMISGITPLAIWEMMMRGDNMEFARKGIPEEFYVDFDSIVDIISKQVNDAMEEISGFYQKTKELTDKELGIMIQTQNVSDLVKRFVFPYRKGNCSLDQRSREWLYRAFRPKANSLDGYTPSSSMNRIQEDE